jgi:hypothetical protein
MEIRGKNSQSLSHSRLREIEAKGETYMKYKKVCYTYRSTKALLTKALLTKAPVSKGGWGDFPPVHL